MLPDTYAYPAFFYYEDDGISVEFPDIPGCLTCAETTEEAFRRAREALGLNMVGLEQDNETIPAPSPVEALRPEAGAVLAMVDVFMPPVRANVKTVLAKKTLTIPVWLDHMAKAANINFSQVLQEGLKQRLGVQ